MINFYRKVDAFVKGRQSNLLQRVERRVKDDSSVLRWVSIWGALVGVWGEKREMKNLELRLKFLKLYFSRRDFDFIFSTLKKTTKAIYLSTLLLTIFLLQYI